MDKTLEAPVFTPSLEDVRNLTFEEYVESVEPQWGPVGVCRIVSPEGWSPRRAGYGDLDRISLPRSGAICVEAARGTFPGTAPLGFAIPGTMWIA
jgi:jumonji domain-containing protein 2